uniref:Uncharacterized protein n=1 Tax=Panagrolaimus davidi TaxID=227884 RepID=A0A914NZF4_9BILA
MNFYVSDSVLCRDQIGESGGLPKKNCTSCVSYYCPNVGGGWGCPEDFFQRCSENDKEHVDVVKSKNFNDMEYRHNGAQYISGCQNESDGNDCLRMKDLEFNRKHRGTTKGTFICTEAGKPCRENDDGTSSSNTQHDALKMIGIFVIGWVLSAA